jgi:hypothetical protein
MFSKKTMVSIAVVGAMGLGASTSANATVIDAYFGMNFVSSYAQVSEVELLSITYTNGSGTFTAYMPVFPGVSSYSGQPYVGLPDGNDSLYTGGPTYTTVVGGNGETTRTIGATVPIDWNMTNPAIPTIEIFSIDVKAVGGVWTATTGNYTVGLIPFVPIANELSSPGLSPQDDIYGNPVGTFVAYSVPPGFEGLEGTAFGQFSFAAAEASPVPAPAAVWLFGSGLLGLASVARRRMKI